MYTKLLNVLHTVFFSPSGGGVYDVLVKRIMIKNQKIKGTLICGPLFFKWMGLFQSWLDFFSVGV